MPFILRLCFVFASLLGLVFLSRIFMYILMRGFNMHADAAGWLVVIGVLIAFFLWTFSE